MQTTTRYRIFRARGFAPLEIVVMLSLGVLLTTLAFTALAPVGHATAVRSAGVAFTELHSRARALAVSGELGVRLAADFEGDSVWIVWPGHARETVRFRRDYGVTLDAPVTTLSLCMTARGLADPECGTSGRSFTIDFHRNRSVAYVDVLPLGQVILHDGDR